MPMKTDAGPHGQERPEIGPVATSITPCALISLTKNDDRGTMTKY
jgi:hypothetical protein